MKIKFNYIILLVLCITIMSCEKDNFDPPTSQLSGNLVYQGTPINLQHDRVSFELYQEGFGKTGAMNSTFTSEGEFSHLLFDGTYKMVIPTGQGPFLWEETADDRPDTLMITVNGNTTMDIEVTPYWIVTNPQLSFSGGDVTGTLGLEQIVTGDKAKDIEHVTLYVSKTLFADSETSVATDVVNGGDITDLNNISLSATIPSLVPAQNYVFASIGVKFSGVDDMIFSPTQKITF